MNTYCNISIMLKKINITIIISWLDIMRFRHYALVKVVNIKQ